MNERISCFLLGGLGGAKKDALHLIKEETRVWIEEEEEDGLFTQL